MAHSSMMRIDDNDLIIEYLESRSETMTEYVKNNKNKIFSLWFKNLTHSDLTNRGKRNGSQEGLDKNYLYYLSVKEMVEIEKNNDKPFESAKQSNIGLTDDFYKDLGMPRLQRRIGPQKTQHSHIRVNDYAQVLIVNDTIKYFTADYSNKVMSKLGKEKQWDSNETITLNDGDFTEIQLTEAIHGLGTADDIEFHKLRLSMFCNDTILLLIEHGETNKLFIMLEKNPRFFTIIGETNATWEKYITIQKNQEKGKLESKQQLPIQDEKSRNQQAAWKIQLAKEMMNYTTHEGEVFCPFTSISADFNSVPMLFIASHIKRFSDSDSEQAYDINNGLLLCANADALFDKHMITVGEDKKLIFSFLISNDFVLRQKLLLNQPIFEMILNEKRMEYMADHRKIFYEKEEERKKTAVSL